jgi:hypothetical protein
MAIIAKHKSLEEKASSAGSGGGRVSRPSSRASGSATPVAGTPPV